MQTKQYRIQRTPTVPPRYTLMVTHGLLDVEILGRFAKQAEARAKAKAHAARDGVKPIILT